MFVITLSPGVKMWFINLCERKIYFVKIMKQWEQCYEENIQRIFLLEIHFPLRENLGIKRKIAEIERKQFQTNLQNQTRPDFSQASSPIFAQSVQYIRIFFCITWQSNAVQSCCRAYQCQKSKDAQIISHKNLLSCTITVQLKFWMDCSPQPTDSCLKLLSYLQ